MTGIPRDPDSAEPSTCFAPPERAEGEALERQIRLVSESPLVEALVGAFGSVVAVLNRHRQVLAVNPGLLSFLGVADAGDLLGLRPGEMLHCVHAHDHPAGCGTSRFCSTCGAAIATVLAQREGEPQERECLLTVDGGTDRAVEFKVRAVPFDAHGESLVLLLMVDIRGEKRKEALERVFLHDVMNTLTGLLGSAESLKAVEGVDPRLGARIERLAGRLADEVHAHRTLSQVEAGEYRVRTGFSTPARILDELRETFSDHPVARGLSLEIDNRAGDARFGTDPTLVHRVMVNMVKNALEATGVGGTVRVGCSWEEGVLEWKVWNDAVMAPEVALRVFQRYFSTKADPGRGLGTYGMKVLGERYLGGTVSFTSKDPEGTWFRFRLPAEPVT